MQLLEWLNLLCLARSIQLVHLICDTACLHPRYFGWDFTAILIAQMQIFVRCVLVQLVNLMPPLFKWVVSLF